MGSVASGNTGTPFQLEPGVLVAGELVPGGLVGWEVSVAMGAGVSVDGNGVAVAGSVGIGEEAAVEVRVGVSVTAGKVAFEAHPANPRKQSDSPKMNEMYLDGKLMILS